MASFVLETTERSALAGDFNTDIDGGTIKVYTAAYATLLFTWNIPAAGSNSVTNGVLTLGAVDPAIAAATGTAAVFRVYSSGATLLATGDVNTAGASINLSTLSINATQTITAPTITFTIPAVS